MSTPPHNGDAKTLGQDNNLDTILDNDLDAMIANSISQPNSIPPPSPTPGSSDLFASSGPTLSSQQELSPHETSWSPSQPQHQDDLASSIRPNSSLFQPSVQQHQPGMSPAIQKRGPSLGLALGGSSFRRKPLFGPDDDDNDDRNDRPQKSVKGKGKKDKAFQDLTQSPDDDPELLGERRDGEEDHIEEDEEEEDANSETPLHPQETIRGLESRHDFNFFKSRNSESRSNSFLSRLGVSAPNMNNQNMGNVRGRMGSPRLGMGPIASSRLNSRLPGKVFIPRTIFSGLRSDSNSASSGLQRPGQEQGTGGEDEDYDQASMSNHLSPIYPGGANPYHDDAVDWVVEGTGMRVAYDDFTTIDWIHDFAQERQRQRKLHHQPGLSGQIAVMYDWIQGWVVVLAVGIAAGIVAGGSDIASQWLGDIKEGYCDTAFYLNRNFCCWGLE
ncbi:hypothetical protein BG003_010101, partial [Podila horticola]